MLLAALLMKSSVTTSNRWLAEDMALHAEGRSRADEQPTRLRPQTVESGVTGAWTQDLLGGPRRLWPLTMEPG